MRAAARRLVAVLLLPALAACVPGGVAPPDPLVAMLSGRTVIYGAADATRDTAAWQVWRPDGTTTYDGIGLFGSPAHGRWTAVRGQYCSIFGTQTEWTCYRVTTAEDGRRIRFRKIRREIFSIELLPTDFQGYFSG